MKNMYSRSTGGSSVVSLAYARLWAHMGVNIDSQERSMTDDTVTNPKAIRGTDRTSSDKN